MFQLSKKVLLTLSLFVGALLFAFAFQHVGLDEIKNTLLFFPKNTLLVLFLVNAIAAILIGGYRWYIIFKAQGCQISFWKIIQAKLAGFSASYITPAALVGGEPVRAYMTKEGSDCGWEKSFASVIIDQMIFFIALFVLMVFSFIMLLDNFSIPREITYSAFSLIIVALLVMYIIYNKTINRHDGERAFFSFVVHKTGLNKLKFIKKHLQSIEKTDLLIEMFFKNNKKTFILAVLLAFLEFAVYVLVVFLMCMFLGEPVSFFGSLEIFFLITLANLVPIPGALGSFELFLTVIFDLLGLGKETGLAFSLIFRFINVALCFVGLLALISFMFKTVSKSFSVDTPPIFLKLHHVLTRRDRK
jgi:uncharacterized protein (TIRG00374 family)